MVQKLNRASALAYLKATMFFDDLKRMKPDCPAWWSQFC